jgi:indole-3-glycerol phosphate synthase
MPSLDRLISASRKAVDERRALRPLTELEHAVAALPPIRPFTEAVVGEEISFVLQADALHDGLLDQCEDAEIAGLCLPLERVGDGDASGLPVLLADVVVDRYQLYESRVAGADGVVLIVAAFEDEGERLLELYGEAADIGLDVLVDVGHEDEIEWSLEQLDPDSFVIRNSDGNGTTDLERTFSLLEEVPAGIVVVSAGGVRDREEVRALERSGVDAVILDPWVIGEGVAEVVRVLRGDAR